FTVHAGHLHFVVEVRAVADAADDDRRAVLACGFDGETRKRDDTDIRFRGSRDRTHLALEHRNALGIRKHRHLAWIDADADDELVEKGRRAPDHVGMAERDRIERARIEADTGHE